MAIASSMETVRGYRGEKKVVKPEAAYAHRDVMRSGPVLVEKENGEVRKPWDLFTEYCSKAKFFIEGEFYGSRQAVMVAPEVKSRNATAKSKTGEFLGPGADFGRTAILAANLSLFDQGKLSEEEVIHLYGPYTEGREKGGIEGLRGMLGQLLGEIKYGEISTQKTIEKRQKSWEAKKVLVPVVDADGEVDTHHFRLGTRADLQAQQVQIQEAESKKTKRRIKVIAACGAVLVTTTACASAIIHPTDVATPEVPIRTQTATNPVPGQSTETPAAPIETATQIPTETMTATAEVETIDMEMYHNVPESYEYLLAHPDEFIHAPNPIDDREAFDRWFNEELMDAIGPKSEREVNIRVNALGHSGGLYSAWSDKPTAITGNPGFFYFEYSGTVIPVMIVNVSRWDPNMVDQTFCVGLFGGPFSPTPNGTNTLQMLSNGDKFSQMDIFLSTSAELLSGVQLGDMAQSFIDSTGDAWANLPDNVAFGLGQVYMVP